MISREVIATPACWSTAALWVSAWPTRLWACSSDQVPPWASTRPRSSAIQYGSVSTRVPSMSQKTACSAPVTAPGTAS